MFPKSHQWFIVYSTHVYDGNKIGVYGHILQRDVHHSKWWLLSLHLIPVLYHLSV